MIVCILGCDYALGYAGFGRIEILFKHYVLMTSGLPTFYSCLKNTVSTFSYLWEEKKHFVSCKHVQIYKYSKRITMIAYFLPSDSLKKIMPLRAVAENKLNEFCETLQQVLDNLGLLKNSANVTSMFHTAGVGWVINLHRWLLRKFMSVIMLTLDIFIQYR